MAATVIVTIPLDRPDADLPEPHHLRPDRRRREGLSEPVRCARYCRRSSVLFLTCHDLGQHLGCYGQATVTSPALDALAASGVRFARSFCTAPQCSPSRASLHTGRYPHSAGVMGLAHAPYGWRLDPRERHVAQLLADAGYSTTLVGMQHLIERGSARELGYQRVLPVAPAYEEAVAAVGVLRELARQDRPFYLEVGFEEPHRPYDFRRRQPDTSRAAWPCRRICPTSPKRARTWPPFRARSARWTHGVGTHPGRARRSRHRRDTCVIFATDHGAAMPRAKCTLYDPGIEVALLWRWPSCRHWPADASSPSWSATST